MKNSEKIYITGHRHPDSDSIVSAIAYTELKKRKGFDAVACRLGALNPETKYLLERFGFDEPMLFEDARSTLAEIALDPPITITSTTTIQEALEIMKTQNKQSLAIVNSKNKLMGMVTKSDLAEIGLSDTAVSISLLKETPTDYIAKTISGEVLYDDDERHFNGKVSVIAIAESRLKNYDLKDRLVIVGNDTDAQLAAIRKHAGILMVVWCDTIEPEVYELAQQMHCPIIKSGHGTMNTTRYLYFSPPVRLIMKTDLISFNINEFVEEVGMKMLKSRYRSYPVVDDENRFVGYVSRFHVLNQHNKKVILVDHNEFSQSVKSIEKADLLEIVDHHRISDIVTSRPIAFRNEIIGSTAAIIASIYFENQMEIPKRLAGLLLGAIISDTLKFKSPTTTEKDRGIAKVLAEIANLDIDAFAKEMFKLTSNISNRAVKDLIRQDIKKFEIDGKKVMIAQVIAYQVEDAKEIETELEKEMKSYVKGKGLDLLVMAFTSILENGSVFYAAGKLDYVVAEAFPNKEGEEHSFQADILSRKNQFVPLLSRAIINTFN
ncbi:putative manganese-dependent inorganic diphosphatase [Amedibacillus dolichus]|uniref:inorganic diphosphatase n=2 Tax=Amedibacillus dolichus TaxID=31971 RepID=A0A415P835_9FIRM|nr:putative manganese-dependent inorganic diphosphatase [Amedibacillus dolichus]MBS4883604.1 putative manganese-dependent inorganic diphosphatase [Amedibacillus dolichus]RHM08829.1 putative manganese-dependent inorganic diphosphatase [Amedibacillus dolichus]